MECLPDVTHQAGHWEKVMICILFIVLYKGFWSSWLQSLGLLNFLIYKIEGED